MITMDALIPISSVISLLTVMASVKGAIVGVGTMPREGDLDAGQQAGSTFAVSPGLTESVSRAAMERGIPLLPGVANASDIMRGLELGLDQFKFSLAEAAGGIKALKALLAPFSQCRFCPTGGITLDPARGWFGLETVLCIGGSWLVN